MIDANATGDELVEEPLLEDWAEVDNSGWPVAADSDEARMAGSPLNAEPVLLPADHRVAVTQTRLDEESITAVAERVVELLHASPPAHARLDANEVAARLGVSRTWIYNHSTELGAERVGDGPRPRVRFPSERIEEYLSARSSSEGSQQESIPVPKPKTRRATQPPLGRKVPLLPVGPSERGGTTPG